MTNEAAPDPEPSFDVQREMGFQFPGEWAAPILRVSHGEVTSFCGTATVLGSGWFLTARHVIENSLAQRALDDGERFCAYILQARLGPDPRLVEVEEYEHFDGVT